MQAKKCSRIFSLIADVRPNEMKEIPITQVERLTGGRLAISPKVTSPSYEFVYREACEVYWDNDKGYFYSPNPREWSYGKWFGHIVSVVLSSFEIRLSLSSETIFVPDDPTFVASMREADANVQKWIDVERPKIMKGEHHPEPYFRLAPKKG